MLGKWIRRTTLMGLLVGAVLFALAAPALAATAPSLGSAQSFAVLAGSTVTNTGLTVVTGNLGVSPGTAVTGFPPGIVIGGSIHAGDAVAAQAQTDLTTAYNNLVGQPCNSNLTGQDLGGLTLTPGVYCFNSSAQLTGILTLDAGGNANAVFIFQIGSTLTTASNSSVKLINGGTSGNVFWQVGSSATLGTGTAFVGNILAFTSITLTTGANVSGRVLARNGAVTMDTNTVSAGPGGFAVSGAFVIGDENAAIGNNVTFWGAQWAKANTLSGGRAPNSFKGFENSSTAATCGGTWTARPGNSSRPPSSIPAQMAVIVASHVTQSGSTISGDVREIVVVQTNPGYAPNPGHAGTGKVLATLCHS
jgi:hypothetical protein